MDPWMIVIWVVLTAASYYLARSAQTAPATPDAGELEGTTIDASSPVPVLFGTRKMAQPNCVWFGDVGTTPILKSGGGK